MKLKNKNILQTFTLMAILLAFNHSYGQSSKKIFGYVFDSNNSAPLVGANVKIDGTILGTTTNEFGYFQFENLLAGNYSLSTSYIGYKSASTYNIEVFIDQPTEITIFLEESENRLDEILVFDSKLNTNSGKEVKFYSKKDFERSNFQSVGELLTQFPEIEIKTTGGVGSTQAVSIRGSESNQVLVLVDGIPLNNQFDGQADLSQIPTSIIETIEIHQGGSSSQFGSGAIGGAINIITRNNFKNEYKVNLTGGSYGLYKVEPSISGNINNLSYFVSYNLTSSTGNYPYSHMNTSDIKTDAVRINADIESQNIFSRINYKLDNYLFSVNVQSLFSDRGLPGKTNALTPFARSKISSTAFGASVKAVFDKVVIDVNTNYSKSETDNINQYTVDTPSEYTRYPSYHYKYANSSLVLNSNLYYKLNNWLYITSGYNGKLIAYNDLNLLNSSSTFANDAEDLTNGFFLHPEFSITLPEPFTHFTISPTIRYDEIKMSTADMSRYEKQWSPSIAMFLSIGKKNSVFIKSSISRSFRAPTFSDLFFQDVRIEGKPDLLPELSLNKEATLGWQFNRWGTFKGEFTLYKYTVDNMIIWKLGSFEIFRPFNNNAEITGETYSLHYQTPNKQLSFSVYYSHVLPLDKNNQETTHDKIIPYHPQNSFKLNFQYFYKNFSGILNYRLIGKRYVTVANTVELPQYKVLDLSLSQDFILATVKTQLKFSINNIANEQYEIIRNYPIPGREYRLGLTLNY